MPVDIRKYPAAWKQIVARVRERSKGQCECVGECGLHTDKRYGRCIERDGQKAHFAKGKVILTTAHLCHDESCERMDHLRHFCQRCHLRYDSRLHQKHARETRRKKLDNYELFAGETP
jgi:hypothetical protein